jgi:hypothetical protein
MRKEHDMVTPFKLGQIVVTPGALNALEEAGQAPREFLMRHESGDWGEVGEEDWSANDGATEADERLLSCDRTTRGARLWIVTEWDRSTTTVLLAEEY